MKPEKQRSYIFDFYCLNSNENDLFSTSTDEAFERLINGEAQGNLAHYGSTRELFGLTYRSESKSYAGQIRKIRKADLPEVGAPGQHSKTIQLDADEGVIEKNFFVFYKENSLLVMHRNDTGNTGSHLAQLLTGALGVAFYAAPLIRPDQAEKLLNNRLNIKKFSVKIPKPTNPELYPQDSISAKTIELLNQSRADSLEVTFTVDQKLDTSAGRLSNALQSAIGSLLSLGATKAKLETDENGKILPIDLIANRIYSKQSIKINSSFPPSESMYKLADKAKEDQRELLDEYFGNASRII